MMSEVIHKVKKYSPQYSPLEVLLSLTRKRFMFISSVMFTLVAFYPSIRHGFGQESGVIMLGDVINLWVPQIHHSIIASKQLIFSGVDMLTQGGSSEFFMRPNIFAHSPVIFLSLIHI